MQGTKHVRLEHLKIIGLALVEILEELELEANKPF